MQRSDTLPAAEILAAFHAQEAQARVGNTRVGCVLVIVLMPAGTILEYAVYPEMVGAFQGFRWGCTAIAAIIMALLYTEAGRRYVKYLWPVVPLLPAFFIAMMIAVMEGFSSPYYAGLNLVLLAVGAVLQWTVWESLAAVLVVLGLYLAAGLINGPPTNWGTLVSNLVFIAMMDIIVVVGAFFQTRQRLREFILRYELDQHKKILEESNRKLKELDELKSRFFANISHELRTPLTLLIAPLEMLVRQPHRLAAEEVKELLHTMHGNAMRLLKLINDLLDLVRLDSNRMQVAREPVEIYEFLRGLVNSVKKIAADKHLKLELCAPADLGTVMVDRDKLERIILNLVFNSVKFTHGGGRIELQAERKNGELMFHVRDTGVGIAAEQLPFVFDRFWQADTSSQRKYQGAGIGLALVKELTEVQGGKVQATSELGKGTTITVLLPYLPAEKSAAAAPSPAPAVMPEPVKSPDAEWLSSLYRRAELFPSLTSLQETLRPVEIQWRTRLPRLLVADDEPDMLRFLKTQLGAYFEILEAVDGQQAVDKATQFLPDVVHFDFKENSKTKDQYAKDYDEGVGWDDTAGGGGGDGGGRSACGGSGEDGMGAAVDSGGGTGGVSGGVSGGEVWGACCWGLYGSRSGGMGPRLEI